MRRRISASRPAVAIDGVNGSRGRRRRRTETLDGSSPVEQPRLQKRREKGTLPTAAAAAAAPSSSFHFRRRVWQRARKKGGREDGASARAAETTHTMAANRPDAARPLGTASARSTGTPRTKAQHALTPLAPRLTTTRLILDDCPTCRPSRGRRPPRPVSTYHAAQTNCCGRRRREKPGRISAVGASDRPKRQGAAGLHGPQEGRVCSVPARGRPSRRVRRRREQGRL